MTKKAKKKPPLRAGQISIESVKAITSWSIISEGEVIDTTTRPSIVFARLLKLATTDIKVAAPRDLVESLAMWLDLDQPTLVSWERTSPHSLEIRSTRQSPPTTITVTAECGQ